MNKITSNDRIISVEFIGLPGAGKTRFYEFLAKSLNERDLLVYSFRNFYADISNNSQHLRGANKVKYVAWYYFSRFCISHIKYTIFVFIRLISIYSSKSAVKLQFLRFFIREGAAWHFYHNNNKTGFYVSDEGFLHRLLIYGFSRKLSKNVIETYINKCPKSDIIVILKHTVDDIQNKRNYTSEPFCKIFNIIDENDRVAALKSMQQNLDTIFQTLKNANYNLIELDRTTTEKEFLNLLQNTLKKNF